jgi:SAM-dependent methyltransferase
MSARKNIQLLIRDPHCFIKKVSNKIFLNRFSKKLFSIAELGKDHKDYSPTDYNRIHAEWAIGYSGSVKGKKCLVIGCNTGKDCTYFVKHDAEMVNGIDIIDEVGSAFKNPKVKYFRISAENMDGIENDRYDLVYCFATMEHIHNIDMAFSEMVRVCKPGGIIYCVAAPLWNSRQGHHKANFFGQYPWIHLRMNEDEIIRYCEKNNITDESGTTTMKEHIAFMLNPEFFNKLPARRYIEVCNSLKDIKIIRNHLDYENKKELPPEILSELEPKGFTPDELLALTHTFIAQKL